MPLTLILKVLFGIPAAIGRQVLEGLLEEVDRERLITEDAIKDRLYELQVSLEAREISERDYGELEDILLQRLRLIRENAKEASHAATSNPV